MTMSATMFDSLFDSLRVTDSPVSGGDHLTVTVLLFCLLIDCFAHWRICLFLPFTAPFYRFAVLLFFGLRLCGAVCSELHHPREKSLPCLAVTTRVRMAH